MLVKKILIIGFLSVISSLLFSLSTFAEGGHLINTELEAAVIDNGTAEVKMEYMIHVQEGTESIPFTLAMFSNVVVNEVTAFSMDTPYEVEFEYSDEAHIISGNILLSEEAIEPKDISITIYYNVEQSMEFKNEDNFNLILPVLTASWPPLEAAPNTFTGTVTLPDGAHALESFPTPPQIITGETVRAVVNLQVIPSLVSIKGTIGEPPFFTFNKIVDAFVIFLILLSAFIAVIAIKRKKHQTLKEEKI